MTIERFSNKIYLGKGKQLIAQVEYTRARNA